MKMPISQRLKLERFDESDVPALAELLADTSITRHITANGSSPERRLASARKRIKWHNSTWDREGFGVWALRAREAELASTDVLLGWCGFIPPDGDDPDPEILYAINADYRGIGLAGEAANCAISWLFDNTHHQGVTAVISTLLNPDSVKVATRMGLTYRGGMAFSQFLPDRDLADEVAEAEIWRLAHGPAENLTSLIEQVAFRSGQLSTVTSLEPDRILDALLASLSQREGRGEGELLAKRKADLTASFHRGRNNAYMDCFHVTRDEWTG